MAVPSQPIGIVLAGAAALGAYEAGVLHHIFHEVARELGSQLRLGVISGTSAGAINATALAAFADDPRLGSTRICETWAGLRLGQIMRPSAVEIMRSIIEFTEPTARLMRALRIKRAQGGFLDSRPIWNLLATMLPVSRVQENLRSGCLQALAISATDVASGHATVFYQSAQAAPAWESDGSRGVDARIGIAHAMASSAIPLLLPPVMIDGELYCDGGLRQMVPLSPSIHLGANRLLVVNPLTHPDAGEAALAAERRAASASPLYLTGKALNALFADRTEVDLARLDQLSAILRAGKRRYGPSFEEEINAELARDRGAPVHEVTALRVAPSRDLGRLAAEYAAGPELARRERGLLARFMAILAETGPARSGDLLAYLLFDGGFASELIALGRADASRLHTQLCELFGSSTASPQPA